MRAAQRLVCSLDIACVQGGREVVQRVCIRVDNVAFAEEGGNNLVEARVHQHTYRAAVAGGTIAVDTCFAVEGQPSFGHRGFGGTWDSCAVGPGWRRCDLEGVEMMWWLR